MVVPILVLVVGAVAYWLVYHRYRMDTPVHSDGEGYYAYLPAYVGRFDPSFNTVVSGHMIPVYGSRLKHEVFGLTLQPTGNWYDKYGVGTAMLMLPFFLAGHVIAAVSGAVADGYSRPEVFATGAGALVYTVLGLLALRAVLRRWFGDVAVALTLVAITIGTSAFSYFAYDATFSHDYELFAVAVTLLAAVRWYERPASWWRAALLGAAMGLVVAVRITNVVLLLAVPLFGVGSLTAVRARLRLLLQHAGRVVLVIGSMVAAFAPQIATWYIATGHLIVRPYPGESFDFAHPHLLESLVWLQPHGLLPYAPVLAFSFVGVALAWFRRRDIALPVTVAFLPFWYLTSAWYDWSFSSAFGDRAYIDVLPLLALPMAYLFSALPGWRSRTAVAVLGTGAVAATCTLMIAWWQIRMPGNGVDARQYVTILTSPQRLLDPPR